MASMKPVRPHNRLDDEIGPFLDAALDDGTKRMLEAEDVLRALLSDEEDDSDVDFNAPCAEQPRPAEEAAVDTFDEDEDERAAAVRLATIRFRDGDRVEFHGVFQHGELGHVYIGENLQRMQALASPIASPLRIFASLAPPRTPVPWLIAAVDRPRDRGALMTGRCLVEVLDRPIAAEDTSMLLKVPAIPGGWWAPDGLTLPGHFCGPAGTHSWVESLIGIVGMLGIIPFPAWSFAIHKRQDELGGSVTHHSTHQGQWYRRWRALGLVTGCGTGVRVVHRYRELHGFSWRWVIARSHVISQNEMQGTKPRWSPWLGLARRRRRIEYTRLDASGGLRIFSRFAQSLT